MTVYLVGAGPGDPGLLTVRAAELLARADVVVHDRLSAPGLLDLAPAAAERISVGKDPSGPSVPQERINELLVDRGLQGLEVVRLKGGDPFVFARGAEEALALAAAGIDYEVVPGITSAIAVPAYGGIPVTMRYSSTSFTVVTGHEDPTKPHTDVNWEALARVGGTIVILMGVANIAEISRRLIDGGLPATTPVAAVRWGTRPDQTVVRATLGTIVHEQLRPPSTIVVGDVAAQDLDWFAGRPLFGRRVVVTRALERAGELSRRLRAAGADVVEVPTIHIGEPSDGGRSMDRAIAGLARFDWVVLTSPNGARRFLDRLRDARDLAGVRLAAIGPGTAKVLAERHLQVDLVPERFVAEALLDVFPDPDPDHARAHGVDGAGGAGGRVLIARAEVARDVLPDGLRARGWQVEIADAYRTVPAEVSEEDRRRLEDAEVVTFASASSVHNYLAAAGRDLVPPVVAAIGPITADAARAAGLDVAVEAPVHTIDGLVAALVEWAERSAP